MNQIAIIDHVGAKAGMDYYSNSLALGLASHGATVRVYSNFQGSSHDRVSYCACFEGGSRSSKLKKMVLFLAGLVRAVLGAKKNRSDLVILHVFATDMLSLLLVLLPKIAGLRVAIIGHDISSLSGDDNAFIENIIYQRLADMIIVHNNYSRDCLFAHVHFDQPEKVHVIRHGGYSDIVGQPLSMAEARASLGLDQDKKYLLFFGQIKKVKGLDILLKAMTMIPDDIHLIIAGKPWKANFEIYEALIAKYGLERRIKPMIRFISDDERKLLFFAADANVLPYRVIYQSGVLLMAMSHGLPVIASDLPGNKEIIRHNENGLLFATEDANELSQQISAFFADPGLAKRIAAKAQQTIEQEYQWNDIAKCYLQLIH